jgi:hypothetical protein
LTQATQQATYPSPLNRSWKERVLEISANNVLIIPSTRARPSTDKSIPVPVNTLGGSKDDASEEDEELPSPSKRHRTDTTIPVPMGNTSSYWLSSPDAHHLFGPSASSIRGDSNVSGRNQSITKTSQEALKHQIQVLLSMHRSKDSWHNVIIGRDIDNLCTMTEIFETQQRATFLCRAYQLA